MSASIDDAALRTVRLVSCDGVTFLTQASVANLARVLRPALEASEGAEAIIPLPGVSARPLASLLDYCAAAAALEVEEEGQRGKATFSPAAAVEHATWAAAWLASLPAPDLFPLAAAASYLDVSGLLELVIGTLASRLKGRPPALLRSDFALPDDLPPPAVSSLRADCAGAFDPPTGW